MARRPEYVTMHPQDDGRGLNPVFYTHPATFVPVRSKRTQMYEGWGLPEPPDADCMAEVKRIMETQMLYFGPEVQFVRYLKERKARAIEEQRGARRALRASDFTLRVSVWQVQPAIWREFRVSGGVRLSVLHDKVVVPLMGWSRNYHTFLFADQRDGALFGQPDSAAVDAATARVHLVVDMLDARDYFLSDLVERRGDRLLYVYDLGDSWRHVVEVVGVEAPERSTGRCVCVAGQLECPPEDSVGLDGMGNDALRKHMPALVDATHPAHRELVAKVAQADNFASRKYSPTHFSVAEANRALAAAFQSRASDHRSPKMFTIPAGDLGSAFGGVAPTPSSFSSSASSPRPHAPTSRSDKKRETLCACCGSPNNLKKCGRCLCLFYCSRACQAAHWKAGHKDVCKQAGPQVLEERAERLRDSGNALFAAGRFEAAERKYTKAIELSARDVRLFANRSACRLAMAGASEHPADVLSRAVEDALAAISLNRAYAKGWYRLVRAHCANRMFVPALTAARDGLAECPACEDLRAVHAVLRERGVPERAPDIAAAEEACRRLAAGEECVTCHYCMRAVPKSCAREFCPLCNCDPCGPGIPDDGSVIALEEDECWLPTAEGEAGAWDERYAACRLVPPERDGAPPELALRAGDVLEVSGGRAAVLLGAVCRTNEQSRVLVRALELLVHDGQETYAASVSPSCVVRVVGCARGPRAKPGAAPAALESGLASWESAATASQRSAFAWGTLSADQRAQARVVSVAEAASGAPASPEARDRAAREKLIMLGARVPPTYATRSATTERPFNRALITVDEDNCWRPSPSGEGAESWYTHVLVVPGKQGAESGATPTPISFGDIITVASVKHRLVVVNITPEKKSAASVSTLALSKGGELESEPHQYSTGFMRSVKGTIVNDPAWPLFERWLKGDPYQRAALLDWETMSPRSKHRFRVTATRDALQREFSMDLEEASIEANRLVSSHSFSTARLPQPSSAADHIKHYITPPHPTRPSTEYAVMPPRKRSRGGSPSSNCESMGADDMRGISPSPPPTILSSPAGTTAPTSAIEREFVQCMERLNIVSERLKTIGSLELAKARRLEEECLSLGEQIQQIEMETGRLEAQTLNLQRLRDEAIAKTECLTGAPYASQLQMLAHSK
eukprot:m51a1_g569 hypothetical protein (1145) ;mRNA; r:516026-520633